MVTVVLLVVVVLAVQERTEILELQQTTRAALEDMGPVAVLRGLELIAAQVPVVMTSLTAPVAMDLVTPMLADRPLITLAVGRGRADMVTVAAEPAPTIRTPPAMAVVKEAAQE